MTLGVGLLAAPLVGPAQESGRQTQEQQRCDLMENQYLRSIVTGDGSRITYISGPVLFVCEDGTRIRADSVVEFSANQFRELMGGVEIDGPDSRISARRIHRSTETGRTQAWGDVRVVEKESETRMVGDTLIFLEANQFRQRDRLEIWGGRPYAVLLLEGEEAPDTTTPPEELPERIVIGAPEPEEPVDTVTEPSAPPTPDTVFADRLYMEGRTRFLASGSVRVRRADLDAYGDSLDYDRELSRADLLGTDSTRARLDGEEYDLSGRELNLLIQGHRIRRVDALYDARLAGEQVRIEAPRVRVFLSEGELERLVAVQWTGGTQGGTASDSVAASRRAEATAEDFFLRADSIEVQAGGGNLDRVVAVGRARGESLGRDSLNAPDTPETVRRDWIEGDTVVAHFVPADSTSSNGADAAESSGARARLDRLVATGNARSLYRMTPRDSTSRQAGDSTRGAAPPSGSEVERSGGTGDAAGAPEAPAADTVSAASARSGRRLAVHYVVGDRITITIQEGDVERMEVVGQTRGLYLEPRGDAPLPRPVPDTAATPSPPPDAGPPPGPTGRGAGP